MDLSWSNQKEESFLKNCIKRLEEEKHTKLDLRGNELTEKDLKCLFDAMKNQKIKILNLASNKIDDRCAPLISDFLEKNDSIEWLNLNNNQLKENGIKILFESLSKNCSLQTLYLNYNMVGEMGCSYISDSLQKKNNLKSLHLDNNILNDRGRINFSLF